LLVLLAFIGGMAWLVPSDLRAQSKVSMPLVPADEELAGFVKKLEDLIEQKQYDHACVIANTMIQRTDAGFYRVGKSARFRPIRAVVNDVLGSMPPEALARYRELFDAQAKQMIADALNSGDMARIRRAVNRYRHTSHGRWALESLAQLSFDRGQFLQASWYWQELLAGEKDPEHRALLLTQNAIASHLAGESKAAREAADELAGKHPDARMTLGQKEWVLVEFVRHILKNVRPDTSLARNLGKEWPGLWTLPGHVGLMEDVDVVLRPNWRNPGTDLTGKDLKDHLVAKKEEVLISNQRGNQNVRVHFKAGQARYDHKVGNRRQEYILPGVVHPLVIRNWLICRFNDTIHAYDIYTGEVAWEVFDFPMFRDQANRNRRYYHSLMSIVDYGRFSLTVGGGKVYALGLFAKPSVSGVGFRANPNPVSDDSALAAFSLESEGTLVWQIGHGQKGTPEDDQNGLPGAKFLSVPTYYDGRLYALAKHMENYWLACIDSDDGTILWKTQVGQAPAMARGYNRYLNSMLDLGTPPSCVEGRVFVVTNSGVLGCFDSETGQPIWAYQYQSNLPTGHDRRYRYSSSPLRFGMNPIVVTPGRVTILPADSDKVQTFAFEDGRPLWQANRQDMLYLAAVDENRLVLSGRNEPGKGSLAILSARDGKVLHQVDNLGDVYGRPAVTDRSVVVSVTAGVARVNLEDYRVTKASPSDPEALLGNLVFAGGKMFAANPLGVAAYFPYETQYAHVSRLLEESRGEEHHRLLLKRADISYSARRYDRSLEDFLQLQQELADSPNEAMKGLVRQSIYRNYIALGNNAESLEEMGRMFRQAREHAVTTQEKGHMLLRMAKYHALLGEKNDDVEELTKAIDLATTLIAEYGSQRLVDVKIGNGDQDNGRFSSSTPTYPSSKLADDFIGALIEKHGQEPLKPFESLAKEALEKARAAKDPEAMVTVARKYKHGQYRDDALFAAAEIYYLRAYGENGSGNQDATRAVKLFSEVISDHDSPLRVSSAVALASIYARAGKPIAARMTLEQEGIGDQPDSAPVSFANVRSTLGQMRKQIQEGRIPRSTTETQIESSVEPPLEKVYAVNGTDTFLVRDQNSRPIRIGQNVLVLTENRAPLLDTTAKNYEDAIVWEALTSVDVNNLRQTRYYPPDLSFLGGISADGKTVLVADRKSCSGFSAQTGKRIWHKRMEQAGLNVSRFSCMAAGSGVFVVADATGNLICLEMDSGEKRWDNKVRLKGRSRRRRSRIGWPLVLLGDHVAVRSSDFGQLIVFDLKTGKAVQEFEGRGVHASRTPDGLVLVTTGQKLLAFGREGFDKPLWEKEFSGRDDVRILAAEAQMSIVTSRKGGFFQIDLLSSMGAREPMASIPAGRIEGKAFLPLRAVSDKHGGVVVLGTSNPRGNPGQVYGRNTNCRNYYLRRYAISSQQTDWTCELVEQEGSIVDQPLRRVGDYILAGCQVNNRKNVAWLVDVRDGKIKEHLSTDEVQDHASTMRIRALSIPAVTSGRLLMEDARGITVYRGR
jgi:outer membrane protein assembly factor BamB